MKKISFEMFYPSEQVKQDFFKNFILFIFIFLLLFFILQKIKKN